MFVSISRCPFFRNILCAFEYANLDPNPIVLGGLLASLQRNMLSFKSIESNTISLVIKLLIM